MEPTLTLSFETFDDLAAFVAKHSTAYAPAPVVLAPITPPQVELPEAQPPKVTKRSKKQPQPEVGNNTGSDASAPSNPPPAEGVTVQQQSVEEAPADENSADVAASPTDSHDTENPFTIDDVKEALSKVIGTKDASVALGILKKFEAARISDLNPESWGAFIIECESAVA